MKLLNFIKNKIAPTPEVDEEKLKRAKMEAECAERARFATSLAIEWLLEEYERDDMLAAEKVRASKARERAEYEAWICRKMSEGDMDGPWQYGFNPFKTLAEAMEAVRLPNLSEIGKKLATIKVEIANQASDMDAPPLPLGKGVTVSDVQTFKDFAGPYAAYDEGVRLVDKPHPSDIQGFLDTHTPAPSSVEDFIGKKHALIPDMDDELPFLVYPERAEIIEPEAQIDSPEVCPPAPAILASQRIK